MNDHLSIRPVRPQECLLISALAFRSKAHWGYSAQFMEATRAELSVSSNAITDDRVGYWLAENNDGVAGFVAIAKALNNSCRLELLFVEPHCMGRGVGKRLVNFAKSYAKRSGAQTLHLQSDPNAAPFYIAMGGVQVGESESDSIPGRFLPEISISID